MITPEDQPFLLQMKDSYLFYHKRTQTQLALHSAFNVQMYIKHSSALQQFLSLDFQLSPAFIPLPLPFHSISLHAWGNENRGGSLVIELFCIHAIVLCKYGAVKCKLNSAASPSQRGLFRTWGSQALHSLFSLPTLTTALTG